MHCSNGHLFAAGKLSPKFCPICGIPVTNRCVNGHNVPPEVSECPLCGTATTPASQHAVAGTAPQLSASTTAAPVLPPIPPMAPAVVVSTTPDPGAHPTMAVPVPTQSRVGLIVGLVIGGLLVTGALVAVILAVGHRSPSRPVTTQSPPPTESSRSTSPVPPTHAAEPVTTTTLAPGLVPVDTGPVSSDPGLTAIALTFETYFGGIDNQNWNLAYSAYSSQYQSNNPESAFQATDSTSSDTNASITSITPGPFGSTIADVDFVSAQTAADGPVPGEACTDWTLAYTLVPESSGSLTYRINSAATIGPGHVGCPGQP